MSKDLTLGRAGDDAYSVQYDRAVKTDEEATAPEGSRRCAFCKRELGGRDGVGTGRLADGMFCDLLCLSRAFPSRYPRSPLTRPH